MGAFNHADATTLAETQTALAGGKTMLIAGKPVNEANAAAAGEAAVEDAKPLSEPLKYAEPR